MNVVFVAKAVHGSGRVGFGPNPDSTQLDRVIKNLTHNQPNNGSDPVVRVNRWTGRFGRLGGFGPKLG